VRVQWSLFLLLYLVFLIALGISCALYSHSMESALAVLLVGIVCGCLLTCTRPPYWRTTRIIKVSGAICIYVVVLMLGAYSIRVGMRLRDCADGADRIDGASGLTAARSLEDQWPAAVDPSNVDRVDMLSKSGIDGYSTWWKVSLTEDAAEKWTAAVHQKQSDTSKRLDYKYSVVLVQRTLPAVPRDVPNGASSPQWWPSTHNSFKTTEAMLWHRGQKSGAARATYSSFDANTGILVIHEFACQHCVLWPLDNPPQSTGW
jgi:hypothetical protein